MPRVPAHLRERALGMLQGGMRIADVARAINCHVRTVRRLRQRYRETGRTADHPRSGRPRVTTPAQDRYIRISHLRDRPRSELRKERSRDAARSRRSQETEVFYQLAHTLPLPRGVTSHLDKAAIMRLTLSFLRMKRILQNDSFREAEDDIDGYYLNAIAGFVMVLSSEGDLIYLSENVSKHLGVPQLELVGQSIFDFVHPCDQEELRDILTSRHGETSGYAEGRENVRGCGCRLAKDLQEWSQEWDDDMVRSVQFCNKVDDVMTAYKLLFDRKKKQRQQLPITMFMQPRNKEPVPTTTTTDTPLETVEEVPQEMAPPSEETVFELLGYQPEDLIGRSAYEYHHALDSDHITKSFHILLSKGQMSTGHYRFLAKNGGFAWAETCATVLYNRKSSQPEGVICLTFILSGLEETEIVFSVEQTLRIMKLKKEPGSLDEDENKENCLFLKTSETTEEHTGMATALENNSVPLPDYAQPKDLSFSRAPNDSLPESPQDLCTPELRQLLAPIFEKSVNEDSGIGSPPSTFMSSPRSVDEQAFDMDEIEKFFANKKESEMAAYAGVPQDEPLDLDMLAPYISMDDDFQLNFLSHLPEPLSPNADSHTLSGSNAKKRALEEEDDLSSKKMAWEKPDLDSEGEPVLLKDALLGTYPDYKASPVNSGENPDTVSYSSRMKDQQMTSDTSPASKSLPFSPSGQLSQDQSPKPLDSISSSKYTPTFYYTSERQTPPLGQHERSPSPSPRSVISEIHNYDQMSPVQSSRFFAQTQKKSSSSQSLQYDTGSLGRSSGWSPQKERSPSPHPASVVPQEFAATPRQSKPLVSSTLPRNFREIKTYDDVQAPQKPTGIWNESNLDVAYEKRSHQKPGYERLDKLRPNPPPSVLVSNWRESNLDAPPSAVKDSLPSNPEYGSLPRMTRKPIPGEWQYNSLPMRTTGYPPSPGFQYGQQPIISRINVPPQFQKGTLSGPLPLSVIMRLQSPFWNSSYSIPQRASDGGSVPARNAPLLQPHMPQQMPPTEKAQPAKEGGVAGKGLPPAIPPASDAGDIEPELEHLGEVVGEPIEQVPRPLSPTRLQPVLPHIDEKEPEMQEVLRIRAEIPRALKKRTSVDSTISGPLLPPSHRKQYQQIINKLFRRRVSKKDLDVNEDTIPEDDVLVPPVVTPMPVTLETEVPAAKPQRLHSILKKTRIEKVCSARRARLSPLVLLLDAALVGDLDTVQKSVWEVRWTPFIYTEDIAKL
ncbi:HIF3A factor, partial [Polypterus senegalus]